MENEKGIVKLSRKQLYDDIWEMSVAGVARKYNLVYAKLIEVCKESGIPFPSSGYWTRRNMGKDVSAEIVAFEGDENVVLKLITNDSVVKKIKKAKTEVMIPIPAEKALTEETNVMEENVEQTGFELEVDTTGILEFLNEEDRSRVVQAACALTIVEDARLHKALVQYKKKIAAYNEQLKKAQSREYYNPRYNKPADEPEFFKEVSEEGIKRFMCILDILYKTIEKLGGEVYDDLSIRIRRDVVRFRVAESKDKIKHELTKQEAQALIKYEDEKKRHSWASKPQIRQYDHVYNGRLRIVFGEKRYIRDSENEKLEDRLGDILISLYEKSEENRIDRERREEEQRKRDEEKKIQEELSKLNETQIKLTKELANKAEDYRIASDIRAYINAVIEMGNEEATPEWIEWARKKADWYDPTIACEDEFLGKRDHGKNKEDKDLDKIPVRRSRYW
jgi:hypothetical protein